MSDIHKNFAYALVETAPSPADTGTSLIVTAGKGALFPAAPFNAVIWPAGVQPISTNAEIVRVTAINTDTFTIIRIQEGTPARTVVVGDQIAAAITAKTLEDTEGKRLIDKDEFIKNNYVKIVSGELVIAVDNELDIDADGEVDII